MKEYRPKVLIIATSAKTRGGITSVIKAHQTGTQWNEFNCRWIETHIDKNNLYKLFYFIKSFIQFILNVYFYDIIHIHLSEPMSAFRKVPFFIVSKILKKKTIIHFHSYSPDTTINGKFSKLYRYLFTHSDVNIVLSNFWKEAITKKLGANIKIKILYNPCNIIIPNINYPKKNFILYAGTLNKRKGYKDLIEAFSLIAEKYPDWELIFAGNGEIEQGKVLAKQKQLQKQIKFLGWIKDDIKDKIFKESRIFCLPSYAEGFPMAVLDAWAYNLPVIATPVGGLTDIATNYKNIIYTEPGDIRNLAQKISFLLDNKSKQLEIQKEGKLLADTTFNINQINSELRNLYLTI